MKNNGYIYNSYQGKKQLGAILLIFLFGLSLSLIIGYINNISIWVLIGMVVGSIFVLAIIIKLHFPIKVNDSFIYLPYRYREEKDKEKIPLSEIWWIKRIRKSPGRKGLKFRDKENEYFIPNFVGYSEEVFEALEEAIGDKFYKIYRGEE